MEKIAAALELSPGFLAYGLEGPMPPGRRPGSARAGERLADALGVSPAWLAFGRSATAIVWLTRPRRGRPPRLREDEGEPAALACEPRPAYGKKGRGG